MELLDKIIERLSRPLPLRLDDATAVALPLGWALHKTKGYTDDHREAPERREGTTTLLTLDAFTVFVSRFKDTDSVVYVDGAGRFVAVLDHHRAGPTGAPRFGRFRAVYASPLSREWAAWADVAKAGRWLSQTELAEHLQAQTLDLLDPGADLGALSPKVQRVLDAVGSCATPDRMRALAADITVHTEGTVREQRRLASGEATILFEELHKGADGQPLKIPACFLVAIPVLYGGPLYRIPVLLRYRVQAGKVVWQLVLHDAQARVDHAIAEAATRVRETTGLMVLEGTPA